MIKEYFIRRSIREFQTIFSPEDIELIKVNGRQLAKEDYKILGYHIIYFKQGLRPNDLLTFYTK